MAGIQQVWTHDPPKPVKGKSLLERIGGSAAVTHFVNSFYDGMLRDKEVAPVLKKSQQTQSEEIYMKLLKERTVEYLECVWGGDHWEGQDMFVAHAALHISTKTYDVAMKIAKRQINNMGCSADAKKSMMEELWALKEPMCDPEGKFHAWVHEKNKAIEKKMLDDGAVDLTGMGFTTSPAMVKAMQEKADKEKQRKERMLAQKAKREAEEKEARKKERRARKEREETASIATSECPSCVSSVPNSLLPVDEVEGASPKIPIAGSNDERAKVEATAEAKPKKVKKKVEEEQMQQVAPNVAPSLPPEEDGAISIPESLATPLLLFSTVCVA